YDLTSLIRKLTRSKVPVLGLVTPQDMQQKLQQFGTMLSATYTLKPVDLASGAPVPDDVDGLFIIAPREPISPAGQKALDQFIMKGKSAAFFLDALSVDTQTFQGTPVEHGLTPLLAAYGVTLGDALVADVQSGALSVQERRGFMVVQQQLPYPFMPALKQLEGDSAITAGITGVVIPFTTTVQA